MYIYYYVFDLVSSFYQIPFVQKSHKYTSFSTSQRHWKFNRMIMDINTLPTNFQKFMNNALSGIIGIKYLVYLDDINGKNMCDNNSKLIEFLRD